VRSGLALLGGIVISAAGVGVAVRSDFDLVGALLIAAGGVVAAAGQRWLGAGRPA
jgi:hypothetical protein